MARSIILLACLIMAAAAAAGCSRKPSAQAAAQQLQDSFQKAEAPIVEQVTQARAALASSNYTQAILILDHVVQNQPVSPSQREAVDALIIQTRQAIQRNPKLDSPQLYQALSDLLVRVHGEN